MALRWLDYQSWWEVSRSERYFCLRLFNAIEQDVNHFIRYLNDVYDLRLSTDIHWEISYEVSFYRDLSVMRGEAPVGKIAREFDLALFSDETIIIIEAKSQSKFNDAQTSEWLVDPELIKRATGVDEVIMIGLTSSKERATGLAASLFLQPYLTWRGLQAPDGPYLGELAFLRADEIHMDRGSKGGSNADARMTGAMILESSKSDHSPLWVGVQHGLNGTRMKRLIIDGWREAKFEVNYSADEAPNSNWFSLEAFLDAVERGDG